MRGDKFILLFSGDSAPVFNPADLFGDGDAGDLWLARSIVADPDDPVAAWVGLVNATSLEQAVAGRQPTLRASGSKRWLEFDIDDLDGSDVLGDCLLGEFTPSTAELTVIVAAHNQDPAEGSSDDNNRRTVCLKVPAAGGDERDLNIFHNLPRVATESGVFGGAGMRHPENAAVNLSAADNAGLGTAGVVTYQRNGTAIQDAWIDGEALTRVTTTTTTFTVSHLGIGYGLTTSLAFNTTGVGHWIGRIAGVLIIDRVLTAGELAQAEAYMRSLLVSESFPLTAPTLVWDSGTDDPLPNLTASYAVDSIQSGDTGRIQFATNIGFDENLIDVTFEIDGDVVSALEAAYELMQYLPDALWRARHRIERTGVGVSGWSNIVGKTLDSAPVMTSSAAPSVDESDTETFVMTLTASQPSTFAIGGTDAASFEIQNDDELHFLAAPDYEDPQDDDTDNVYDITITPTATADSEEGAAQNVAVTVNDVIGDEYAAETEAIAAAFTTPPTTDRKNLIEGVVSSLKTAGVWAKLDVLYVFAAADSQAALINWKDPGTFDATVNNSPTFTADEGYTADGDGNTRIDMPFNASTAGGNYAANDASVFGWARVLSAPSGGMMGTKATGNDGNIVHAATTWHSQFGSTTASQSITPPTAGFYSGSIRASNDREGYKNGSSVVTNTTTSSQSLVDDTFTFLRIRNSVWGSGNQISIGGLGGGMTDAEHADLYSALSDYLTGVGAI